MSTLPALDQYQADVLAELTTNILPFYLNHVVDHERGGFYGWVNHDASAFKMADRGLIQNSRLLWTFSHAYRHLGRPEYRHMADHAYHYLTNHFWDAQEGGFFWLVNAAGQPTDPHKVTYGQAFGIYALAEYTLATQHSTSLEFAQQLFGLVEQTMSDPQHGGYWEGGLQNWQPHPHVQLDHTGRTLGARKSMNTHLHLLEAYTTLLQAWPNPAVQQAQTRLLELMLEQIVNHQTHHFHLFFSPEWRSLNNHISYGHDIEGSWLLVEAAEQLGQPALLEKTITTALAMAQVTYEQGQDQEGGIFNEATPAGLLDTQKDWWPQAEGMVGFLNAYQLTDQLHFLQASYNCWQFAQKYFIDREYGEWFWAVTQAGVPVTREKSGPWKAPYHNGRACLEVYRRLNQLQHLKVPYHPVAH